MIERHVARNRTLDSLRDGYGGDTYRRVLVDGSQDKYVCGCEWKRDDHYGDVLALCPIHSSHKDQTINDSATDPHEYHQGIDGLPGPHGEWECQNRCVWYTHAHWCKWTNLERAHFRRKKAETVDAPPEIIWRGDVPYIRGSSHVAEALRTAIQTAIALLQHPGECAADRALQVLVEAVRQ